MPAQPLPQPHRIGHATVARQQPGADRRIVAVVGLVLGLSRRGDQPPDLGGIDPPALHGTQFIRGHVEAGMVTGPFGPVEHAVLETVEFAAQRRPGASEQETPPAAGQRDLQEHRAILATHDRQPLLPHAAIGPRSPRAPRCSLDPRGRIDRAHDEHGPPGCGGEREFGLRAAVPPVVPGNDVHEQPRRLLGRRHVDGVVRPAIPEPAVGAPAVGAEFGPDAEAERIQAPVEDQPPAVLERLVPGLQGILLAPGFEDVLHGGLPVVGRDVHGPVEQRIAGGQPGHEVQRDAILVGIAQTHFAEHRAPAGQNGLVLHDPPAAEPGPAAKPGAVGEP